jgi:nicotinamidase-related amidase
MSTLKVAVFIDVQNCFISGGSFGGGPATNSKEHVEKSFEQIKEIDQVIDENELIVFTRDFHPEKQSSLADADEHISANFFSTWLPHCRNKTKTCDISHTKQVLPDNTPYMTVGQYMKTYEKILSEIPELLAQFQELTPDLLCKPIKGTDLSFLFTFSKHAEIVRQFIGAPLDTVVGLDYVNNDDAHTKDPSFALVRQIEAPTLVKDGKQFFQLTKGEYCNYEALSGFNYHLKLIKAVVTETETNVNIQQLEPAEANSTGLFEHIMKFRKPEQTIVEITIAGLVGEVCVIQSVVQGLLMWNRVYKTKPQNSGVTVKFVFSATGTLFIPEPISPFGFSPDLNDENTLRNLITVVVGSVMTMDDLNLIKFTIVYKGNSRELDFSTFGFTQDDINFARIIINNPGKWGNLANMRSTVTNLNLLTGKLFPSLSDLSCSPDLCSKLADTGNAVQSYSLLNGFNFTKLQETVTKLQAIPLSAPAVGGGQNGGTISYKKYLKYKEKYNNLKKSMNKRNH